MQTPLKLINVKLFKKRIVANQIKPLSKVVTKMTNAHAHALTNLSFRIKKIVHCNLLCFFIYIYIYIYVFIIKLLH